MLMLHARERKVPKSAKSSPSWILDMEANKVELNLSYTQVSISLVLAMTDGDLHCLIWGGSNI